jgi:hypothetical protein
VLSGRLDQIRDDLTEADRSHQATVALAGVREVDRDNQPMTGFRPLDEVTRERRRSAQAEGEQAAATQTSAEAQARQIAWSAQRNKILEVQSAARRDALLSGQPVQLGLMAEPSLAPPPGWYPDRKDGDPRYFVSKSDPVERDPSGNRILDSGGYDVIRGKRANNAQAEPSPEDVFRAQAQ